MGYVRVVCIRSALGDGSNGRTNGAGRHVPVVVPEIGRHRVDPGNSAIRGERLLTYSLMTLASLRNINELGTFDFPIDGRILDEFRAALELSLRHLLGDDAIS